MSHVFNDPTTNLNGLVQMYEKEIGANQGDISGSTTKLKEFAAATRVAFDSYLQIAFDSSGTWQFDDSNHTDYPIITANLEGSPTPQRDYSFTTDGSSNLILDIYKVLILPSATATTYVEIELVDETTDVSIVDGSNPTGGVPARYGKMANGIFLDPMPNYDATNGLKILINREMSYFTSSDTTKKPGVPGNHHSYFYLKPALDYARRNNLANYDKIALEVAKLEQVTIPNTFTRRERDKRVVMSNEFQAYE